MTTPRSKAQPQSQRRCLLVKVTPEFLETLLQQGGGSIDFETDKVRGDRRVSEIVANDDDQVSINVKNCSLSYDLRPEAAAIEVYHRSMDARDHMALVGRVTQKLAVRRELAESMADRLKLRTAEERKAKEDRS